MEDTAINLVQAFVESAPGIRKLIHFGDVADAVGDAHPWVGPLVEVSSLAAQKVEQAAVTEVDDRTTG